MAKARRLPPQPPPESTSSKWGEKILRAFYSVLLISILDMLLSLYIALSLTYTHTHLVDKQRGLLELAYAFAHFVQHSSFKIMLCHLVSTERFQTSSHRMCTQFRIKTSSEIRIFLFILFPVIHCYFSFLSLADTHTHKHCLFLSLYCGLAFCHSMCSTRGR